MDVRERKSFFGRPLVHTVLIAVLGLIICSNTFDAAFHLDDFTNIAENPVIKDLTYFQDWSKTQEPLQAMSPELYPAFKRRVIGFLSFALNYRIDGLDVSGYHIVNVALHLINALVVYLVVSLMFNTPALATSSLRRQSSNIAFCTALLFVAHPIQTQAVTYISQRFTSLVAFFYLLSLLSYAASRLSGKGLKPYAYYFLSVIATVMAMKTKENAFTLPLAIALFEFMFLEGEVKKRLLRLTPLLVTLLIIPLSVLDFRTSTGIKSALSHHDFLVTQFRVLVTYFRLLAFPINQNFYYDYPVFHSLLKPQVLVSLLSLASMLSVGIYLLFRSSRTDSSLRVVSFGIFWFFLTLIVESGLIALADVIFEHRLYLPSMGVFISLTSGTFIFLHRSGDIAYRRMAVTWFTAVILLLACASYSRNAVWHNEFGLWQDVVEKSPRKGKAYVELGVAHMDSGQLLTAIPYLERAIVLNPLLEEAHYNLGLIYFEIKRFKDAKDELNLVVLMNPAHREAGRLLDLMKGR